MTTDVMAVPRGRRRVPPATWPVIGEGEHSPDPAEERTLAFLGEILTGDALWRLSEVQKLLELHTADFGGALACRWPRLPRVRAQEGPTPGLTRIGTTHPSVRYGDRGHIPIAARWPRARGPTRVPGTDACP